MTCCKDLVAELHAVQQRRCVLAEQGAVQGADLEGVVERTGQNVRVAAVEAVPDQPEQGLYALVDVVAVQGLAAGEAHELQVAQVFQAVALAVRLGVHRGVAELRPRLDVEQEQQAVHVAQGFLAQLPRELVVEPVHPLLANLAQVPDGLVADELDGFAQRVLEVRGDGEGVSVAVVVQAVEQTHAFVGHQAFAVQKCGSRLQGGRLAPAHDVVEDEAEQAVVGPLAPFEQQDLARREENHPTRGMPLTEDSARDDVAPGLLQNGFRWRGLAVVLRPVRPEGEGVLVVSVRVVGAQYEKLCGALPNSGRVEHGHFVAGLVVQQVVRGLKVVAEGRQQVAEPVALQAYAGLVTASPTELLPKHQIGMRQCTKGLIRRPPSVRALVGVGGFPPARRRGLNVVGEEFRQVVVAVELVLVLDACECRGHGTGSVNVQPATRPIAWFDGHLPAREGRSFCA